MRKIILFNMLFFIILTGCAVKKGFMKKEPVSAGKLVISNVSAKPKTIDVDQKQLVEIKYKLSEDACVFINIYDSDNRWAASLKEGNKEKAGYNSVRWGGRGQNNNFLPAGVYVYVIKAENKEGEVFEYDPADISGGFGLKVKDISYDKDKKQIKYLIPRAARVRIRAGISEGPLLKTLVDWQPREAGENIEEWDGADETGENITRRPKFTLVVSAYSLADNSVILKNKQFGFEHECDFEADVSKPGRLKKNIQGALSHPNAGHSRRKSHEPQFKVEFPEAAADKDGIPVARGITPIRLTACDRDMEMLIESRFEIIGFVDDVFLCEEEQGFLPFNYIWDTKGIAEGEHIVTFNMQTYNDHIGTKSLKVRIGGTK